MAKANCPFSAFCSSCSLIRCCLPSCFLSAFSIWDIRIGSKQSLPQSRIRLQTLHKKAGADPALHRFVFFLPPCRFACASLPGSLCPRPLGALIADKKCWHRSIIPCSPVFAFFIFIGNLGRIPAFASWLSAALSGREILISVLASQVMSNVPAALFAVRLFQ